MATSPILLGGSTASLDAAVAVSRADLGEVFHHDPARLATVQRVGAAGSSPLTSGLVTFARLPVIESKTVTTVHSSSSTVAATGGTLARMGIYTMAAGGALTLVARTASDTTLWAAASTLYSKVLDATGGYVASLSLDPTIDYYLAALWIGTVTAPSLRAVSGTIVLNNLTPILSPTLAAQADLPASVTAASLVGSVSATVPWIAVT